MRVGRLIHLVVTALVLGCAALALESRALGEARDGTPATVSVHDVSLLTLAASDGTEGPTQRAARANRALEIALREKAAPAVRTEREGERWVVYLGATRFLALTQADADAARASSVKALAEDTAARTRTTLDSERRRAALASGVFSVSLVVSFGLIALFLGKRLSQLADSARNVLEEQPERVPSLKLRTFEVLSPAVLRSLLLVLVTVSRWLFTLGLLYAWLIASLSLFDATRGYTERLTSLILSPFSALITRVASALPVLVITAFAILVLALLLRVSTLFFASIARGESHAFGITREHANAANIIVHALAVLATLVFGAPLLSGDPHGTLAGLSSAALLFATLVLTPLAASVMLGVVFTLGGALKLGARVRHAAATGRITKIGLVHTELKGERGTRLLIPHLTCLTAPIQHLGPPAIELVVGLSEPPQALISKIEAELAHMAPIISVCSLDATALELRISSAEGRKLELSTSELLLEAHAAVTRAGLKAMRVTEIP